MNSARISKCTTYFTECIKYYWLYGMYSACWILATWTILVDGLSLLNEDGGLNVFFPNNSFVTNSTLTHTNTSRNGGNDHIVCYGEGQFTTTVTWRNSSGERLVQCSERCHDCNEGCVSNGGVAVDPSHLQHTHIHLHTDSSAYVNQDLECRLLRPGGKPTSIGVYLKNGSELCMYYI